MDSVDKVKKKMYTIGIGFHWGGGSICVHLFDAETATQTDENIHTPGADLAFFQGGGLTQRRCGASSTSRVAASRFFYFYFEPP